MVPGQVVEPEQEILGAGFRVVEGRCPGLIVLVHVAGSAAGAVEADARGVGLVIVGGGPVGAAQALPGHGAVVRAAEQVVQPQGHFVVDDGFAGSHHHLPDGIHELLPEGLERHAGRSDKGLADPFVGDFLRGQVRIPGEAAEGVPVGLGEHIAAETGILARVGDPGDGGHHFRHRGSGAVAVGVGLEAFFPCCPMIGQMVGEAQVFLRNLELHHHLRVTEFSEQGTEGFARLEIHRSVLDLDDHVVGELPVQRKEFLHGLVGPVGARGAVDEGTPHDDAAVGLQRLRQHVRPVGVGAPVILRSGLAFGIGLYQETAEVRDGLVDFLVLVFPPFPHGGIQRVAAGESAQGDGAGPFDGQVGLDSVFAEDACDLRHAGDMLRIQDERIGIHIVEDGSVQAHGGTELSVAADALHRNLRGGPLPHGQARIAPLHGVVQVVPVVQDAEVVSGLFVDVQPGGRLPHRLHPLQGVQPVAKACVGPGVHMTVPVRIVVDMVSFRGQGLVDLRIHGDADFADGPTGGQPEVGPVLQRGLYERVAGGKQHCESGKQRESVHRGGLSFSQDSQNPSKLIEYDANLHILLRENP